MKLDRHGNILWWHDECRVPEETYLSTFPTEVTLAVGPDGRVYSTIHWITVTNYASLDIYPEENFAVALEEDGSVRWAKQLEDVLGGYYVSGKRLAVHPHGGFLLAASDYSGFALLRLDEQWQILWRRPLGQEHQGPYF